MALNNLLASPGFTSWLSGTPLDLDELLFTDEGKPRVAVISIAHLSEAERMFFVTLLLSQTLAWMRRGSGTGSLRALLYMDELFGYMPPVAEPPSKRGFLTLLKQARAYGLGLVLATQNPADLDYKGLSNAGTWFVGRLQTERDRERLIEGLLGAAGEGLERSELQRLIGSLGKRVFLLQNVHEREPVLFHTRWAMSYLAGPMTRREIARLMDPVKAATRGAPVSTGGTPAAPAGAGDAPSPTRPVPRPDPDSSRGAATEPPSTRGFLTLLQQARADGLGLVLATQNPADLDYKGLSNAGTWFVGRLQTERDRERLIEGLLGAAGEGLERSELQRLIGSLGKRVFLLQNVHEREPVLFHTRWAMSYLAGPMTRREIARLMDPVKAAEPVSTEGAPISTGGAAGAGDAPSPTRPVPRPAPDSSRGAATEPPVLDDDVPVAWLPAGSVGGTGPATGYRPAVLGVGRVSFVDAKRDIDHTEAVALLAEIDPEGVRPVKWSEARELDVRERDLLTEPPVPAGSGATYREVPAPARDETSYREWEKELSDHFYRKRRLVLHRSQLLDVASRPGEEERGFRIRLAPLLRAERDRRLGEIQETFGKKIERVDERIRRAQVRREKEEDQAGARKRDFWISAATALGSALLGRKLGGASLGRATTTARGYSRVRKEAQDVELAEAEVARLRQEREELAAELERALEDLRDELDAASDDLDTIEIDPRRTDVKVDWVGLAWVPD
jgi:hypothetical protein